MLRRPGIVFVIAALCGATAARAEAADTYTAAPGTADAAATPCSPAGTATFSCANLRSAVAAADVDAGSTVQLSTGTYTLTNPHGHLTVAPTGALTIKGTGPTQTLIQQQEGGARVLDVQSGTVELSGLEITGGHATTSGSCQTGVSGGGIVSLAPLTLDHVTVTGNFAEGASGGNATSGTADPGVQANGGGICATASLTLTDSTISDDTAQGGTGGTGMSTANGGVGKAGIGGGIDASGALTLTGTTFGSNHAIGGAGGPATGTGNGGQGGSAIGGGIEDAAAPSTPTITGSEFSTNTVSAGQGGDAAAGNGGDGGKTYGTAYDGFPVTITDSQITGGTATGGTGGAGVGAGKSSGGGGFVYGGAIDSEDPGLLTITGSTVSDNTGTAGNGGAASSGATIANGSNAIGGALELGTDSLLLTSSTFSGNRAIGGSPGGAGFGGAMDLRGTSTIVNTTITGNEARTVSYPSSGGGGIELETTGAQRLTLASVTLAGNTADGASSGTGVGGNLSLSSAPSPKITVQDTIIAGGTTTGGTGATSNCDGAASSDAGHNLESTTPSQCGFSSAKDDLVGADPLLGPLAANGASNDTLALGAHSPALGAGGACTDPSNMGRPLTVDERGEPRPSVCDIGAFQHQVPALTTNPTLSGTAKVGSTLSCSADHVTGDQPLNPSFQWLRNGSAIGGATSSHYKLAPGDALKSISCRETVTNTYGSAQATSGAVSIPLPAPQIGRVKQAHNTWRTGSKLATISRHHRRPPVGTTFTFSLNAAANLKLTFTHTTAGRRRGRKCVASTKGKPPRGKRCTRTITDGTITFRNARAGTVKIGFQGRISRAKKLGKGSYKLSIEGSNASGHGSSRPVTFAIAD